MKQSMQQSIGRANGTGPHQEGAQDAGVTPSQLAPTSMFVTLLKILIGFYVLNTVYNLVSYALDPTGSFWRVTAPVFASLVFLVVWMCVARGKLRAGMIILVGSISLYDLLAYPLGYVPYYWAFWNQVLVLVLLLPFTSRRTYRLVAWLTIFVAVVLSVELFFEIHAAASPAAFSTFMRNIVVGLSMIVLTVLMFRVQDMLFAVQARESAARAALLETQQNLEQAVAERTQALTEANQKLIRQNALLTTLHEIRLGILNHLDLTELLATVLDSNLELLNAQESVIHLVIADGSRLEMFAGTPYMTKVSSAQPNIKGEGLVGMVWQTGHAITLDDYATWEQRAPGEAYDNFHACIAAPLMTEKKIMGVMVSVRTVPSQPYSADEVDMHLRLAQIASAAIDNSRLYAALRESEQTLEARVAERTRSLQQALAENDALRLSAIDAATTAERSRLARELHDSVSQAVYGISLGARAAQMIYEKGGGDIAQPLDYIVSLSETALAEIRALIFEMKPESLKDEGMKAAFKKHADVIRNRHAIDVVLKMPATEPAASIDVKYALYRVMQEATHNIIKHARASAITIELVEQENCLRLTVCDDGIGFDPSQKYPGHHGLENMQERITALNGTFQLESALNKGSCLTASVPLRPAEMWSI